MDRRVFVGAALAALALAATAGLIYQLKQPAYVEHQLDPQAMYQDPASDPRVLEIGAAWTQEGWCLGQFHVNVEETDILINVGRVVEREYINGNCAGVGTVDGLGWATVTLKAPLGKRAVLRASDRVGLPMHVRPLAPNGPESADVELFGATPKKAHLDAGQAGRLAGLIESLPQFPAVEFGCPFSDGSYYRVVLHYSGFADRSIRIEKNGCQAVYLGDSQQPARWAVSHPDL